MNAGAVNTRDFRGIGRSGNVRGPGRIEAAVFAIALLAFAGCASLPTNVSDSSIGPTHLTLAKPPEDVHVLLLRATAEWGFKLDRESKEARVVVAEDPETKAGWLVGYRVRYSFTYEPAEGGTRLRIKASGLQQSEYGVTVKEGPTSALKWHETEIAKKLASY